MGNQESSNEAQSIQVQNEGQIQHSEPADLSEAAEPVVSDNVKGEQHVINNSPRKNEIQELKSQIADLRATVEVSRHHDIVDTEIVTMLVKQGHTVESLRQSKPYLFKSQAQPQSQPQAPLEQPKRIIAPTKSPVGNSNDKSSERMTSFVNTLASMITGTQIKQ